MYTVDGDLVHTSTGQVALTILLGMSAIVIQRLWLYSVGFDMRTRFSSTLYARRRHLHRAFTYSVTTIITFKLRSIGR